MIRKIFSLIDYNFARNLAIAAALLTVLSYLAAQVLPMGYNYGFFAAAWKRFAILAVLLAVIAPLFSKFTKQLLPVTEASHGKVTLADLLLVLLPMAFIVSFVLMNDELTLSESISGLFLFSLLAIGFIVVLPVVFQKLASPKIIISVCFAFITLLFGMAKFSEIFSWEGYTHFNQILVFMFVICVIAYLLITANKKLFYLVAVVFFVSEATQGLLVEAKKEEVEVEFAIKENSQQLEKANSIKLALS